MGLTLNETKTKITNLNENKVMFLGTTIHRGKEYSKQNGILQRNPRKIRLQAPITKILSELKEAGFMKNGKSSPKLVLMSLEHRQILQIYLSVLRGFTNYYSFVHNYGNMVSRVQ